MRPRVECSIGDDAMEDCGFLKYSDDNLKGNLLQTLSTLRKHRLFCDVVLNVGNTDIHAHKNVLACVSPHFMEMFSAEEKTQNGKVAENGIPSYRMNGGITKDALQLLVDYAYTANLEVPDGLVKEIYIAASKLRMDRVVKECARHLIADLCPDTCIEIRSLPGIVKNKDFVHELDTYIANEFDAVSATTGFLSLTCVNIEVLYQTKQEMSLVTHEPLCRLVLDWVKRQFGDESMTMDSLLERSHLLYLALDNSLQDCSDLPVGTEKESELIQDYKRLVLKCPNNKSRRKCLAAPGRPRVLIYSREIGEGREDEKSKASDWRLIGSAKVGPTTFVSLVTLNGQLTRISIQIRLNVPASPSPSHDVDVMSASTKSIDTEDEPELFCEVAPMSGPKCGLGVAELNGKLLVCGGYDRGDCLKHVETYCPDKNVWTLVSSMLEARGRVQIAVLDGIVYAVGGSNGSTELDTIECWKEQEKKWRKLCKMPLARSSSGVCALDDKIFCVGGWNGQSGIKQCDVYMPTEDKWLSISPLNTGRYQAGVTAWNGKLWSVGGSDAWNCLSSVEIYDPEADQWTFTTSLLSARRGCGLAPYNGKLYVVGGSDGTHSLSTTEVYDEETKTWTLGPSLSTPRSNVSAVVVNGRLYAIGGFSGKIFLNTMEYLDPNTNEWTTFVPQSIATSQRESQVSAVQDIHSQDGFTNGNHSAGESSTNGHNGNGYLEANDLEVDETLTITAIKENAKMLVNMEQKLKSLAKDRETSGTDDDDDDEDPEVESIAIKLQESTLN